jgi:hypothetical protein
MAVVVQMYKATDGRVFDKLEKAEQYEDALVHQDQIDTFLRSSANIYTQKAHLTVAEKTLQEFCAYLRGEDKKKPVTKEVNDG